MTDKEHKCAMWEYAMLGRLKTDCESFLREDGEYGDLKALFYFDIDEQICHMKDIWNSLLEKPEWLAMEQIDQYEKDMKSIKDIIHYIPKYDMHDTTANLFKQARNRYITDPGALKELRKILLAEGNEVDARYVSALYERETDDGSHEWNLGQLKVDILDEVDPDAVHLNDELDLEIFLEHGSSGDMVLIVLSTVEQQGGHAIPVSHFLKLTAKEFEKHINNIYAYNMISI